MNRTTLARRAAAAFAAALCACASADDGHNHGDAPAAQATASPRLSAQSELFELVGVAEKGQLVVYLDRFASNEPVKGAKVEYEAGAEKGVAQERPDGTYVAAIQALASAESLSVSFTVTAGADTDLLAGELVLAEHHDDGHAKEPGWRRFAPYAAAAATLAALAALAAYALRRPARRKENT